MYFKRAYDRGSVRITAENSKFTRKKTIQDYVKLYSGPEYSMSIAYAQILLIIYISFLFGFGIPIMFPIGLFSIILIGLLDRLLITYFCVRPKSYGSEMFITFSNELIPYSIALSLILGGGLLSSPALMQEEGGENMNWERNILQMLSQQHMGVLLIYLGLAVGLLYACRRLIVKLFGKKTYSCCFNKNNVHDLYDKYDTLKNENCLKNYFRALSKPDIEFWLNEETFLRQTMVILIYKYIYYI